MENVKLSYTTINHIAREQLDLSWMEYGLADLVYRLSNNPTSQHPGWCYASKETLGQTLGISKQSVHNLLNHLEEKNIITRQAHTANIKTTEKWYETVEIVKKVYSDSKESLPEIVKKVYTTNKNNNKRRINNIDTGTKNIPSVEIKENTLAEEIQEIDKSDRIRTEYQFQGLNMWENLKAPVEKKGSFIKVARDEAPGLVNEAYNFAKAYPVTAIRWKMFFKTLHNLKQKGAVTA